MTTEQDFNEQVILEMDARSRRLRIQDYRFIDRRDRYAKIEKAVGSKQLADWIEEARDFYQRNCRQDPVEDFCIDYVERKLEMIRRGE